MCLRASFFFIILFYANATNATVVDCQFNDECTVASNSGYDPEEHIINETFVTNGEDQKFLEHKIKKLKLLNVNITELPPDYLCNWTSLEEVSIQYWKLSVTHLKLFEKCNRDDPWECCPYNITHLSLSLGHFEILRNDSFHRLPNLTILKIETNGTMEIDLDAFASLAKLQKLVLHLTTLQDLPINVFEPLVGLACLNLSHNNLTADVFAAVLCLPNLKVLDLSHNVIFEMGSVSVSCTASSVQKLYLNNNRLTGLGADSFQLFPNLQVLNLNDNRISKMSNATFVTMKNLRRLYLRGNSITSIPSEALSKSIALESVDLSFNRFRSVDFGTFRHNVQLKVIDLSENFIHKLIFTVFPDALEVLNLKCNTLRVVDLLQVPKNLTHLDLSDNVLRQMCPLILISLQSERSVVVNAERNQLECGCELDAIKKSKNGVLQHGGFTQTCEEDQVKSDEMLSVKSRCHRRIQQQPTDIASNRDVCPCLSMSYVSDCNLPCPDSCTCYMLDQFNSFLVDCNGGNFSDLPRFQRPVQMFTVIDVSGNGIQSMNASSFVSFPKATELYVKNNSLAELKPETLDALVALKILNMAFNYLRELPPSLFSKQTGMTELYLNDNRLSQLPSGIFDSLHSLKILHLHNNLLTSIEKNSFDSLASLESLTLGSNQLKELPSGIFDKFEFLMELDLSCNRLSQLPENLFLHFDNLRILNLQNNDFNVSDPEHEFFQLQDGQPFAEALTELDLSRNFISRLPDGAFTMYPFITNLRLRETNLSTIMPSALTKLYDLEWLDLESNLLVELPSDVFHDLKRLVHLNLGHNRLSSLSVTVFQPLASLRNLSLEKNLLTEIHSETFSNLRNLQVLHLESNLLLHLPSDLFFSLTMLSEVHLCCNRFRQLPAAISSLPRSLGYLDLRSNSLTDVSEVNSVNWSLSSTLMLSNNPWHCVCEELEKYEQWLEKFVHTLKDFQEMTCISAIDRSAKFQIHAYVASHCSATYHSEFILASVMGFTVLCLIILILIYVYRHEMQVMIYSRTGVRFFYRTPDWDHLKKYDAFIAYSSEDTEFVALHLVPGLEQIERPYKLCIHERDFLAGPAITENIIAAIEQSRRNIVVLTENFADSRWCNYEFKTAHQWMLMNEDSRVILIIMDKVPRNIDPDIKLYLKTHTYLRWGEKLFWQKLYFAMPDKTVDNTQQ